MNEPVFRAMVAFACSLAFISLRAQNEFTAGQDVIRNNYDGVEATYTVVTASKSSVHVKLRNTTQTAVAIELMITPAEGAARLLPLIRIEPGRMEVRNIGDIVSLTTSMTVLKPGEATEKPMTTVVDQITKHGDKLTSLKFGQKEVARNEAADKKKQDGFSDAQATAALELIFTKEEWAKAGPVTAEDRKMALKFMKELIEKSCPMAVVEGIFHFQYSFDYTLVGLARYISENIEENCLQKEYESVRKTIAWKYKGAFENRKQLGEWML